MKLKKFKYLLSIGATALAIAPIASLAINATNNAIVKTNVVNTAESSTGSETDATSALIVPTEIKTGDANLDPATLSPAPNDLYNDYNYESGYVVKSGINTSDTSSNTSPNISFYNWFKKKVWSLDLTSINGLSGKTFKTVNVRGALTSDGTYDTKLFVYGNFASTQFEATASSASTTVTTPTPTSGSFVFEVDMTNGAYIENSLVTNNTGTSATDSQDTTTTLIPDANNLTVVDANTVIVTSIFKNTDQNNKSDFSFGVSQIEFNEVTDDSTNTPSVSSQNVTFGANAVTDGSETITATLGQVLGVIKKDNDYLFAFSGMGVDNGQGAQSPGAAVYFWNFNNTNNNNDVDTNKLNLSSDKFTETKSLGGTNIDNRDLAFDSVPVSTDSVSDVKSGAGKDTKANGATIQDYQNYLLNKANNFSVVYSGTIENPEMYISFNWDSTDLTGNAASTFNNKVIAAQFSTTTTTTTGTTNTPILGTYSVTTTTNGTNGVQSGLTYLGISNLVSTRIKPDGSETIAPPYAVVVAYGTSRSNQRIWFNMASLGSELTKNSSSSDSNDNPVNYVSTSKWYCSDDIYMAGITTSGTANNIDWYLQFIPNNGVGEGEATAKTFYGYISTGTETNNAVALQENFISFPGNNTNAAVTDLSGATTNTTATVAALKGYQFGITDDQLQSTYKAATIDDTTTTIDPNSIATEATKNAIIANLSQVYSYNVSEDGNKTVTGWAQDTTTTASIADASGLVVDAANGTISGTLTYKVKNYWNNGTTPISITIPTLQLSKPADYSFDLSGNNALDDSNTDPKSVAKWLEAKYSFEKLFPSDAGSSTTASADLISFLKDLLTNANMGATLKAILINSLSQTSTNTATTDGTNQGSGGEGGTTQQSSVKLQADSESTGSATDAAIKVGQYITVTPNSTDKSVAVGYDLSAANLSTSDTSTNQAGIKGTLNFKGFTGTIDPNSTNYNSYQNWSGESSPADNAPTPGADTTPQTPTNNDSSSSLSGGAIAGIIIAVLVVIALIIGIYFFVKKRKSIQ